MQQETHFTLAPATRVPRIWTGLWQISSSAWGSAPAQRVRDAMANYVAKGYTAFDTVADHSGPAEDFLGQFIKNLPEAARPFGAVKWAVVHPMEITFNVAEAAIDERRTRMQTPRLDLLQLFWQDYQDRSYFTALKHLLQLRSMGKIRSIGLCNFDTRRTDEICTVLGPGAIVSNQVQFSIVDVRPLHGMCDICERHDIKVLAYGTLCGGFLTDQWLGKAEPELYSSGLTPSQRKYLDVILKAWGTWELFQVLLRALRDIADRHEGVSIANVAVFEFTLTARDKAEIEAVLRQSKSASMIMSIGDCGAEFRR
ncbi:hypothetical protein ONZ51_g8715 [Trametes cubensis]|uniref:NADP-dependent oxidoreductase domain-containing protein n=1 Tax=Trametes cubensis TaxID=1111947 RepID=A0AAD7X6B6_9APHY|nr:hypothetical protein ONZ51_g8715 [Trametes cubensis]